MTGPDRITLRIDALAFGGDAVGRDADGRVVFVAGGAPGDLAEVQLTVRKKSFARGELVRVIEAGAARVAAPCPLADRCGGCPWQEIAPAAQLAAKQAIVERALQKSGARIDPIAEAPAWLGYRTRARLSVGEGAIGFLGRRSHRVVDVDACPALDPALDRALQAARRALRSLLGADDTIAGLVGDGAHLSVTAARVTPQVSEAARALVGQAGIVGVLLNDMAYGEAAIDAGDAAPLRVSGAGFAQANRRQNEALRRLVLAAARAEGASVLELYAGDGNFTRDLAPIAREIVAVEGDPGAAARLRSNVAKAEVHSGSASKAVSKLIAGKRRFDCLVLDPPRAGAADVCPLVPALQPARIVYVSCDPMTLARDIVLLEAAGYQATVALPIDLMPQTSHVEVVCTLERA